MFVQNMNYENTNTNTKYELCKYKYTNVYTKYELCKYKYKIFIKFTAQVIIQCSYQANPSSLRRVKWYHNGQVIDLSENIGEILVRYW